MTMTASPTAARRGRDTFPTARQETDLRPRASDRAFLVGSAYGRHGGGRREQRAALMALIDGARAGRSGAIIVRGAEGSGKTHLLDEAIADAADCLVLRSTGVEVESGVAFGTVQQLCARLVDRVGELPPLQAQALAAALGLAPGHPAPALVGLGLVSLLTALASEQPVLCVLDDAEWIDESSAQAMGVAARRLEGVGVVLVVATGGCSSVAAFEGMKQMRIHPLPSGEAQGMLSLQLPGLLDPGVRDRMLAEARGVPGVIRELGQSTSVAALAGGYVVDVAAEVDAALEARVAGRLSGLPDAVTEALLLAAAEPLGDATWFKTALSLAGLSGTVQRVDATGLMAIGDRVLFNHPLVRHVIYRHASDGQRRHAHRVLAESVDDIVRPDQAIWHRAQACAGPADETAQALERSSDWAGRVGGSAAAAAFMSRAAELSAEPGERTRRALEAARLYGRCGAFADALWMIADVDHQHVGDGALPVAHLAAAEIAAHVGRPEAARDLLAAAERVAVSRPGLSVPTSLSALDAASYSGRLGSGGGVRHTAARVRSATTRPGRDAFEELLDATVTRWSGHGVTNHRALARAIEACRIDVSAAHPMATRVAMGLWQEEAWAELGRRDVEHARRSGDSARLPRALDLWACLHVLRGEIGAAVRLADEAVSVARQLGVAEPGLALALLTGWRSSVDDPLEWTDEWSRRARERGDGSAMTLLSLGRSVSDIASGRYEQALHEAQHVLELDEPFVSAWAAPEVVEAAVRAGRPEDAAQALEVVRSISGATRSSWALGLEHRCLALLAEDGSTEQHFRESIRHLGLSGMKLDLARTLLLYGEWLRRQTRRADARTPLRQALEMFDATGAGAFTRRASLELRASGEQARRRTPDTLVALTEREAQVAELAIEGCSNPDIGKQLFISSRTVEYHLHKVFTKLGIASRMQLRTALQG